MAATLTDTSLIAGQGVFTRVLVGIDGSPQSLEAARQGAILQAIDGRLTLLAVWTLAPPIIGGTGTRVPYYFDEEIQRAHAEEALRNARDHVETYTAPIGKVTRGTPWDELIREIERDQDTLVAVGTRGLGRLRGIVVGSVATEVVHKAACSVLIAHPAGDGFPRRIIVGIDGSPESAAAYGAARSVAERFDGELTALVGWGGKGVSEEMIAAITGGEYERTPNKPADALVKASETADLLVVGSRGLHGLRALGSVSERVAHQSSCTTLIVREPPWQHVDDQPSGGGESG